jgi:hypothetical protein
MQLERNAAGTQWPLTSPAARASFLYTPTGVTPGFQPGHGIQYTTMQQPNGYGGFSPALPVHSTDGPDTAKQHQIMAALKSSEYGVVTEGDMIAAATRVNALTALHDLRSQLHSKYSLPGRIAEPLSIKDRAAMIAEVTRIAHNLVRLMSRNKYLTHNDVLSCARDILADLHFKWPRPMLMEAFKKGGA